MTQPKGTRSWRLLIIAGVSVIVLVGLAVVIATVVQANVTTAVGERPDALAGSTDECVACHRQVSPGIVEQYGHSTMAAAEVACQACHVVQAGYPGAVAHEGVYVLNQPTTAMCETCHQAEVAQFNLSRHGLPAYVAYAGQEGLSEDLLATYQAIPEAEMGPIQQRSVLYDIEGERITEFACETCHDIGKPAQDEAVGQCQKCHLRHEFSLEQARKPETCNACHIGPDHPQWEIYQESPHGIAYMTGGHRWNWEAEPGTLDVTDFPAATCAVCHMSGFGTVSTSHDVGDRLSWYLFAPISERRPNYQENTARMQGVCLECHNSNFIEDFYAKADDATMQVNDWVAESNEIMQPLKDGGLLTDEPFDQSIDFTYYELWHHWGRTAKFGAWMQGPDYTQWHGAYELLSDLVELREYSDEMLGAGEGGQ